MTNQIKLTPIRVIRPFVAGLIILFVFHEFSSNDAKVTRTSDTVIVPITLR